MALFLAEHGAGAGHLSASEIGRLTATSDATVVRTAQRLGHRGLADLKQRLAAAVGASNVRERLDRSLDRAADAHPFVSAIADGADATAALHTPALLEAFDRAADRLAAAERVLLAGAGPSSALADYGARLLHRVGVDVGVLRGEGRAVADDALGLRAGDVLVLLAYGAPSARTRVLLGRARAVAAPVVLLTDSLPPPAGDVTVLRSGRGPADRAASHVTTVLVLEAIALAVATRDPERASRAARTLEELRRTHDRPR